MGELPVDRGWSWFTVLGAAWCMFCVVASFKSQGILFVEFLEVFEASSYLTALMMGVTAGGMSLFSPTATYLAKRYSCRVVVLTGSCLCAVSAFLTSFATNIYLVICIYGGITGIGYAMMYGPGLMLIGIYFKKRRTLANGLALAGASVGQLIIPLLMRHLIKSYGVWGALRVYAAFLLHGCVAAMLMRPPEFYTRSRKSKNNDGVSEKDATLDDTPATSNLHRFPLNDLNATETTHLESLYDKDGQNSSMGQSMDGTFPEIAPHTGVEDNIDKFKSTLKQTMGNGEILESCKCSSVERCRVKTFPESSEISESDGKCSSVERCRVKNVQESSEISELDRKCSSVESKLQLTEAQNEVQAVKSCSSDSVQNLQDVSRYSCSSGQYTGERPADNREPGHTFKKEYTEDDGLVQIDQENQKTPLCKDVPCVGAFFELYRWDHLTNTLFLIYVGACAIGNSAYVDHSILIPPYAKSIGVSKDTAARLLATVGIGDFIGRIAGGWFADFKFLKRSVQMSAAMMLLGGTTIVCSCFPSFWSLSILCVTLGVVGGAYVSMYTVVLIDFLGLALFPSAFGLMIMFQGLVNTVLPSFLGLLKDLTGTYQVSFITLGALVAFSGSLLMLEPCARRYEKRKLGQRS